MTKAKYSTRPGLRSNPGMSPRKVKRSRIVNSATGKPVNPPNPKQKFGDLKAPLHLVPPALQIAAAIALGEGAGRYGPYNWRDTDVESMTYIGAFERHLAAYKDGEDIDPDSTVGKRHLDGMAACLAILLDATDGGFLIDNRPPKGPAPRLLLRGAVHVKKDA